MGVFFNEDKTMTDQEKLDKLEYWATRAAEELQQFCDDAQQAAGNPDGVDQLPGVRQLISEINEILLPPWVRGLPLDADDQTDLFDAL